MIIISRVAAQFKDKTGVPIYTIGPADLNTILYNVPDAIRADPLYDLLVSDGSIETAETPVKKKALEQDPTAGIAADGKKEKPADQDPAPAPKSKSAAK
jgi:hypothetical protein